MPERTDCKTLSVLGICGGLTFAMVWIAVSYAMVLGDDVFDSLEQAFVLSLGFAALVQLPLAWAALAWLKVSEPLYVAVLGNLLLYEVALVFALHHAGRYAGWPAIVAVLTCPATYPLARAVVERASAPPVVLGTSAVLLAVVLWPFAGVVDRWGVAAERRAAQRYERDRERPIPGLFFFAGYTAGRAVAGRTLRQAYSIQGEDDVNGLPRTHVVLVYARRGDEHSYLSVVEADAGAVHVDRCTLSDVPADGGCVVVARSADGTPVYAERRRLARSRGRPREVFFKRAPTAFAIRAPDRGATIGEYLAMIDALHERKGVDIARLLSRVRRGPRGLERGGYATYLPTALPAAARLTGGVVNDFPFDRSVQLSYELLTRPDDRNFAIELRPDQGEFRPPRRCVRANVLQTRARAVGCRRVATTRNHRGLYVARDPENDRRYYIARVGYTLVTITGADEHGMRLSRREVVALVASLRRRDTDRLRLEHRVRISS